MRTLRRSQLIIIILLTGIGTGCLALQEVSNNGDELSMQVAIPKGTASVEEVARDVTEQSGIRVDVSEAIRQRSIVLAGQKCTVRAILDAITEVNGWTWRKQAVRSYVITRKLPRQGDGLAQAIRSALPLDV